MDTNNTTMPVTFSFFVAVALLRTGQRVARKSVPNLEFRRVQFNGFAPSYVAYFKDDSDLPEPSVGFSVEDIEATDWYLVC